GARGGRLLRGRPCPSPLVPMGGSIDTHRTPEGASTPSCGNRTSVSADVAPRLCRESAIMDGDLDTECEVPTLRGEGDVVRATSALLPRRRAPRACSKPERRERGRVNAGRGRSQAGS